MRLLNFIRIASVLSVLLFSFFVVPVTFASSSTFADLESQLRVSQQTLQGSQTISIVEPHHFLIVVLVKIVLGFVGTTFIVLLIYGGYLRFDSHGDETRIEKSNKVIQTAIIGITVILLSFAITKFIVNRVLSAANNVNGEVNIHVIL